MSLLQKIKSAVAVLGIKPNTEISTDITKTTQEDHRDIKTKKRVNDIFDKEEKFIFTRSLMPHGFDCQDPVTCTNQNCFQFVPDKIVGEKYVFDPSKNNKKT